MKRKILTVLALVVILQLSAAPIANAQTPPAAPAPAAGNSVDLNKPAIPTSIPVGKFLNLKGKQKSFVPAAGEKGSGTDEAPKGLIGFLVFRVIDLMVTMIGSFALLVFIYGGVLLIMSQGKEDRLEKGKTAMLYSIIGIVVALLSSVIVAFVQSSLF